LPDVSDKPSAGAPAPIANGPLPCSVSKVLAAQCLNCHGATPIAGAPMPLATHADFHKQAVTQPSKKVHELVKLRINDTMRPMPPVTVMPAAEKTALDQWLASGAPAGGAEDASCAPAPAGSTGPSRDGTFGRVTPQPGETCYEFKIHGSFTSVDDSKFMVRRGELYEQFYYNVPWPAKSVATSFATIADNEKVLHHWLLFSTLEAQTHGNHFEAPLPTLIGTDPVLIHGWAVGAPNLSSDGHDSVGYELPDPGRVINVQMHFYNSTDTAQGDASSIQVCTVPRAMRKNIAAVSWLGSEDLNGNVWFGGAGMPPHKESTFTSTCTPGRRGVPANESIHILGFEPHMHRIGKNMKTSVLRAGGMMENVFDKPFSFGNETHYNVSVEVKPGDKLVTSCTFNNTNDVGVPFGESSDTEMCYQFVTAYPAHALSNGAPSLLGVTDACW